MYANFYAGKVTRRPMLTQFKDRARRDLLDRCYAAFPQVDWLRAWSQFCDYAGFYYAYAHLAKTLRDYSQV